MTKPATEDDLGHLAKGVAVLATCIVQTLSQSDPTFEARVLKRFAEAHASGVDEADRRSGRADDLRERDVSLSEFWRRHSSMASKTATASRGQDHSAKGEAPASYSSKTLAPASIIAGVIRAGQSSAPEDAARITQHP